MASSTIVSRLPRPTIARMAASAAVAEAGRVRLLREQGLRRARPVLQAVAVAVGQVHGGGGEGERGIRGELLGPEAVQPRAYVRGAAVRDPAGRDRPQPASRLARVARRDRVLERGRDLALALVPFAGATVQLGGARRLAAALLGAQHLAQQRVVAVLRVGRVERHERDARPREVAQHGARPVRAQDRVAHRTGQRAEDRRAHQERDARRRQPRQHLVAQVVGEEPVVAGEAGAPRGAGHGRRGRRARRGRARRASPRCGAAAPRGRRARGRRRPC